MDFILTTQDKVNFSNFNRDKLFETFGNSSSAVVIFGQCYAFILTSGIFTMACTSWMISKTYLVKSKVWYLVLYLLLFYAIALLNIQQLFYQSITFDFDLVRRMRETFLCAQPLFNFFAAAVLMYLLCNPEEKKYFCKRIFAWILLFSIIPRLYIVTQVAQFVVHAEMIYLTLEKLIRNTNLSNFYEFRISVVLWYFLFWVLKNVAVFISCHCYGIEPIIAIVTADLLALSLYQPVLCFLVYYYGWSNHCYFENCINWIKDNPNYKFTKSFDKSKSIIDSNAISSCTDWDAILPSIIEAGEELAILEQSNLNITKNVYFCSVNFDSIALQLLEKLTKLPFSSYKRLTHHESRSSFKFNVSFISFWLFGNVALLMYWARNIDFAYIYGSEFSISVENQTIVLGVLAHGVTTLCFYKLSQVTSIDQCNLGCMKQVVINLQLALKKFRKGPEVL